jgi:hypothetical protein
MKTLYTLLVIAMVERERERCSMPNLPRNHTYFENKWGFSYEMGEYMLNV